MASTNNINQIAVMTSIAPYNIDNQRKAISSWLAAGFKVMSYNCLEEIEKLRPHFGDIEFVEAKRDARKEYGKPYVYFTDIMEFFKKSTYEACGIINSDIHFRAVNQNIIDFIMDEVKNSLVFGQRVDIDTLDDLSGSMYIGFDYFFFDRKIAGIYPEEKFCIGQPVWDYWILVMAVLSNIKVKKLLNPIAYHVKHNLNWSETTDKKFTDIVLEKYIRKVFPDKAADRRALIREYRRLVFHCNEEIYYKNDNSSETTVLIVLEGEKGGTNESSITYKSIVEQNYNNLKVIKGSKDAIDIEKVTEKYIYYVKEGLILNKYFLNLMVNSLKGYDCSVCGIKVVYEDTMSIDFLYPIDTRHIKAYVGNPIYGCIIYKTEFLKRHKRASSNDTDIRVGFVGQGLVENIENRLSTLYADGRYDEIIKKYVNYNVPEAMHYVGESYIAIGQIEKGISYLYKFIEALDNNRNQIAILSSKIFDAGIFNEIFNTNANYWKSIKLWDTLYNVCLKNEIVRFKVLYSLYNNKFFKKLDLFKGIESAEVNFYLGRMNKDLGNYKEAIHYLNKYINEIRINNKSAICRICDESFRLSACFHLGEALYYSGEIESAKTYFIDCQKLTGNTHKRAEEYLSKIDSII